MPTDEQNVPAKHSNSGSFAACADCFLASQPHEGSDDVCLRTAAPASQHGQLPASRAADSAYQQGEYTAQSTLRGRDGGLARTVKKALAHSEAYHRRIKAAADLGGGSKRAPLPSEGCCFVAVATLADRPSSLQICSSIAPTCRFGSRDLTSQMH